MSTEYDRAFDEALAAAAVLGAALARFDNAKRRLGQLTPPELRPKAGER
jgi:hypothetical protein